MCTEKPKLHAGYFFILLLTLAFTSCGGHLFAQIKTYRHQLTLVTENDCYISPYRDRYYTNGLMLRYHRATPSRIAAVQKKIFSAEVGQLIYNPYKINAAYAYTMDRPFTGFLYAKGGLSYITGKGQLFRWSVQAGVLGRASLGEEMQRWFHKNFGFRYPYGWETQLRTNAGINLQAAYYHPLVQQKKNKIFDVHALAQVTAGTLLTQASTGFLLKLGAFEKSTQTALWDARLQTNENEGFAHKHELFFYLEPAVTYQLYNATVQGNLLSGKAETYTTRLQPFYYSQVLGAVYAKNRTTFQYSYTFKTREAATMHANENYGSIKIGYRF